MITICKETIRHNYNQNSRRKLLLIKKHIFTYLRKNSLSWEESYILIPLLKKMIVKMFNSESILIYFPKL